LPLSIRRTPRPDGLSRPVALGLCLTLLVSLVIMDLAPTQAANWSRQIAATRAAQLYHESVMRAADQHIRATKRATKQTQRKLRSGKRTLKAARVRRARLGARYRETRQRFKVARQELATAREAARRLAQQAEQPAPALMDPAGAVLALGALEPSEPGSTDADQSSEADGADFLASTPLVAATTEVQVDTGDVRQLRKQMKRHRRAYRSAAGKSRRVARLVRSRARSLTALRRQRGAAISRRESAEAGLAGQIMAMSRLAQRRAAKKTKVRPGASSGFSWPVRGRLTQSYGCTGYRANPARGSCRHFHDGIDVAGYRGSAIRAAAVGVVSYVGWNPWDQEGRAFMVVVAHPGGYESLYGHVLPTRRVRVGQLVNRGEVIAYMGNTGRSTGVHLHLEMRRGGTTLNPLAFL
jgi:murein DD-endopeptidase MepM/ murein hydrolase activator NlpD